MKESKDRIFRIAFDAKRAFNNYRGLGNYSRDVIRLFTTYAPQNDYLLLGQNKNNLCFSGTRTMSPIGFWTLCPSLWRSLGCVKKIRDVDVYHGLSGELPYGINRIGVRSVVTIHDAIFIRYPELYSYTYRKLFTLKVQYACDVADTIIAISEQTKNDITEFFRVDSRKIKVVYQGCNNIFREKISEETITEVKLKYRLPKQYIIDVGAIEPRKNLKNLIRAISYAKVDVPLVVVGGRSRYANECVTLAKQLGVRLMLLHDVPFRELPVLYKGAEVSVYPSLFEGFGIPILEAMCVGVPVLTSVGSCFAETGGDAVLYADPQQPESIGSQLVKILTNTTLRETMISKGGQQANKFTDENVAKHLLSAVLNKELQE